MGGWLALCVSAHLVARAFRKPDLVPPVFLAGLGRIAGLRLRVEGTPCPRSLLLANHVSWLDIPALAATVRAVFIAHEGLAGQPVLKWLCEQNRTVFIARSRRGTVGEQVEQVRAAFGTRPLVIFPEGTTGDALLPFRSSLLAAIDPLPQGTSVQPVLLAYEDVQEIAWVDGEPGIANARRILSRRRPVRLTVHFLEPLSGPALASRKTIAAAAREAIEHALA
ncbi:lysophospholipid acyltransferase family protein [Altericroceibacterium xinjiangense]|uniref:lysophospholipid acyltransferase family protein n=1 Tax=Altericroceibacterium xinjiangense TaxID=762261 RepID=UPI001F49F35C|nr:lysophospholipid acyltransferase family protein [Altericroceibacterium xinjiangense]